jgi:hypothetical protein
VAKDSELAQVRVDYAQTLLIAGQVAATAGVDEVAGSELVRFAAWIGGIDGNRAVILLKAGNGPTFADLRTFLTCGVEEDMIEFGALDLDGSFFAGEDTGGKDKFYRFGAIGDEKLGAMLDGEILVLEEFGEAELSEDAGIVGKERFSDMEARKDFLFEDEDFATRFGEIAGCGTATGTSADDNDIILLGGHLR